MKTAIFLGAGASCPFGFPPTPGILPELLRELGDKKLFRGINPPSSEAREMARLSKALRYIFPGLRNHLPNKGAPSITDLLSLLDYCLAESKPLRIGRSLEDAARVRALLVRAIFEVLWDEEPLDEKEQNLLEKACARILSRCGRGNGGVITTNYDTCFEQEIFNHCKPNVHTAIDFGFSWLDTDSESRVLRPRPAKPRLRWLKLHGSLNWLRCPACEHIYINPYGNIAHQQFRSSTDNHNTCHCGNHARLGIHLVVPSTQRTIRDANLLGVWKEALGLLIEARNWVFIGYSLPAEDIAIRSMLSRAYHAGKQRPTVEVVQLGDHAASTYKLMFPGCSYHAGGLESWISLG